ncbi:MAG: glycosyltransferase family 4 protein [Patescibacteria group bacterium]
MILGIDAHKLAFKEKTGTENVSYYFIKNITPKLAHQFDKIILYSHQKLPRDIITKLPDNVTNKIIKFPFLWNTVALSWEMYWHQPDILFVPSHSLPPIKPKKSVIMIHDIGFLDYPNNYLKQQFLHLEKTTASDIKSASLIFTPSDYSKKTIIKHYFADPNKIVCTNLGVDTTIFHPNISQSRINKTLKKYDSRISKKPYLLFLGRLELRKNISNLIKSFAFFKKKTGYPHILVLSGSKTHHQPLFIEIIKSLKIEQDVVFTEHIPQKDLPVIFSEAEILLFPSLYEGFGLPILEAQACRTPVITSNITAMPEIAGNGALLVNPNEIEEIAQAIKKILDNPALRQNLIEKGTANIKKYSWIEFTNSIFFELVKLSKKI